MGEIFGSHATLALLDRKTAEEKVRFPIMRPDCSIGQNLKHDVRLYYPEVSEDHAVIRIDKAKMTAQLTVLGETGLWLNGVLFIPTEETGPFILPLEDGDIFEIRKKIWRFMITTPSQGEHMAAVIDTPTGKSVGSSSQKTRKRLSLIGLATLDSPTMPEHLSPIKAYKDAFSIKRRSSRRMDDDKDDLAIMEDEIEMEEPPRKDCETDFAQNTKKLGEEDVIVSVPTPMNTPPVEKISLQDFPQQIQMSDSVKSVKIHDGPSRLSPISPAILKRRSSLPSRLPERPLLVRSSSSGRRKSTDLRKAILLRSASRTAIANEARDREEQDEVERSLGSITLASDSDSSSDEESTQGEKSHDLGDHPNLSPVSHNPSKSLDEEHTPLRQLRYLVETAASIPVPETPATTTSGPFTPRSHKMGFRHSLSATLSTIASKIASPQQSVSARDSSILQNKPTNECSIRKSSAIPPDTFDSSLRTPHISTPRSQTESASPTKIASQIPLPSTPAENLSQKVPAYKIAPLNLLSSMAESIFKTPIKHRPLMTPSRIPVAMNTPSPNKPTMEQVLSPSRPISPDKKFVPGTPLIQIGDRQVRYMNPKQAAHALHMGESSSDYVDTQGRDFKSYTDHRLDPVRGSSSNTRPYPWTANAKQSTRFMTNQFSTPQAPPKLNLSSMDKASSPTISRKILASSSALSAAVPSPKKMQTPVTERLQLFELLLSPITQKKIAKSQMMTSPDENISSPTPGTQSAEVLHNVPIAKETVVNKRENFYQHTMFSSSIPNAKSLESTPIKKLFDHEVEDVISSTNQISLKSPNNQEKLISLTPLLLDSAKLLGTELHENLKSTEPTLIPILSKESDTSHEVDQEEKLVVADKQEPAEIVQDLRRTTRARSNAEVIAKDEPRKVKAPPVTRKITKKKSAKDLALDKENVKLEQTTSEENYDKPVVVKPKTRTKVVPTKIPEAQITTARVTRSRAAKG